MVSREFGGDCNLLLSIKSNYPLELGDEVRMFEHMRTYEF